MPWGRGFKPPISKPGRGRGREGVPRPQSLRTEFFSLSLVSAGACLDPTDRYLPAVRIITEKETEGLYPAIC
tara:strand:- start:499 stop:714 length:216 start_codon:yes stop_codon:yes gene_type:complete